jgi:hypothetical protein
VGEIEAEPLVFGVTAPTPLIENDDALAEEYERVEALPEAMVVGESVSEQLGPTTHELY